MRCRKNKSVSGGSKRRGDRSSCRNHNNSHNRDDGDGNDGGFFPSSHIPVRQLFPTPPRDLQVSSRVCHSFVWETRCLPTRPKDNDVVFPSNEKRTCELVMSKAPAGRSKVPLRCSTHSGRLESLLQGRNQASDSSIRNRRRAEGWRSAGRGGEGQGRVDRGEETGWFALAASSLSLEGGFVAACSYVFWLPLEPLV